MQGVSSQPRRFAIRIDSDQTCHTRGLKKRKYSTHDLCVRLITSRIDRNSLDQPTVADRGWDQCAIDHHELFTRLLMQDGVNLWAPGRGFRLGMMKELLATAGVEISPSTDHSERIDQAAALLCYGRSGDALQLLENAERRFPFVRHIIATLPRH